MDLYTRVSALESFANHMQITADNLGSIAVSGYRTQPYALNAGPGDRTIEFTAPYGTYNRDVPPPPEQPLAHDKNVYWEHMDNAASVPREMDRQVLEAPAPAMRPFEALSGGIVNLFA